MVVGLLVAVGAMFIPLLSGAGDDSGSPTTETARIVDYSADFRVAADGRLRATETLDVDFPVSKHGIFRFFDVVDPSDHHVRLVPEDIAVTRDGRPDGLDVSTQSNGRYRVAKIGDADTTISGRHRYVIEYTIAGVLGRAENGAAGSQFYWNVIPGGWQMPITRSAIRVELPAAPRQTRCAVGTASTTGCTAQASGTTLTVTTGELEPHTPVTVQTAIDVPPPDRVSLPWTVAFDAVFGRSVPWAVVVGVLALLAAGVAGFIVRSTHEPEPAFPLMYAPPAGIGPAQGAFVMTEATSDDLFAATILEMGERGVATVAKQGDTWTIRGGESPTAPVDSVTQDVAASLGVRSGAEFVADPSDADAGRHLKDVRSGFDSALASWGRSSGLLEAARLAQGARLALILAAIVAAVIYIWNPLSMSLLGLPFAAFAVVCLPVLQPGAVTFRTKKGRDVWSQVGGFRRVLGTRSSEARFDFSGHRELYTQYIPWAVAFGVADVWAEKYRVQMGEDPPAPTWFAGGPGFYAGYGAGTFAAFPSDFSSSVSSAISSYEATQKSSSSSGGGFSGGGFSGGGGGGGGGGGSW
ncbi:DUF2207 domain-containing protein [Williamsia deligens]